MGNSLLLNRDSRGQTCDIVNIGLVQDAEKLACICGKGLDVASLTFGEDRVEGQ